MLHVIERLRWLPFALACVLIVSLGTVAQAACAPTIHEGSAYTVCTFAAEDAKLELFNLNGQGEPFANFINLSSALAQEGKQLIFAMNAGMFDDNLRPIGLYVEDGQLAKKLNRRNGKGNFHLKPNGVFWIDGDKAGVSETETFARSGRRPLFATQSGPMLVIDGSIHPKFSVEGTSRKIRNGVGVTADGRVVFALSDNTVGFHEFARLFRDGFKCDNALFLDGSVSGIYSTEVGQRGGFLPLGPMVGAYKIQ